jgi:hypothetical protein
LIIEAIKRFDSCYCDIFRLTQAEVMLRQGVYVNYVQCALHIRMGCIESRHKSYQDTPYAGNQDYMNREETKRTLEELIKYAETVTERRQSHEGSSRKTERDRQRYVKSDSCQEKRKTVRGRRPSSIDSWKSFEQSVSLANIHREVN